METVFLEALRVPSFWGLRPHAPTGGKGWLRARKGTFPCLARPNAAGMRPKIWPQLLSFRGDCGQPRPSTKMKPATLVAVHTAGLAAALQSYSNQSVGGSNYHAHATNAPPKVQLKFHCCFCSIS